VSDATVYVVDDDAAVGRSLCRLIRTVGLDAVAFSSARAFLEHPRPAGPACLVLDVRMPGLGGLDLQAQLEQSRNTLPIVFITGHGNVPTSVRAMKGGAVDFLQKPFNDDELIAAVQRALGLSRRAQAEAAVHAEIERRLRTLTPRELEVMKCVIKGLLNKQIAGELGAAEKTVKVHRGRVMQKMAANSVADLVHMAELIGLATGSGSVVPPPTTKAR
jgi:FixJ family two-component response regulator